MDMNAIKSRLEGLGCSVLLGGQVWIIEPKDGEAEERLLKATRLDRHTKLWGLYGVAHCDLGNLFTNKEGE